MKKNLILVPTAYSYKALGDIIQFVYYYQDSFNIFILVKDIEHTIEEKEGYTLVDVDSDYGKYLRLSADYAIDAGSMNNQDKVSKAQYWVSVWHGIPYKKMLIDEGYHELDGTIKYLNAYDKMISMSDYYTNIFLRKAMKYNGEIAQIGCSKVDALFNIDYDKLSLVKKELGIPEGKKIALYAPTFRTRGKFELPFDADELLKSLGEDYVLITKLHYLSELKKNKNNIIDCSEYSQIMDLMLISDLLISDYSSLIFDYALLKKPIILFQYDKQEYDESRGVYFDFLDYLDKKNIVYNEKDLYKTIKNKLYSSYNDIAASFYPYEDGHSTKRIVDNLNFNSEERLSKDLVFLINDLNEIGGIHTFINNMASYYKKHYNTKVYVFAINEFALCNSDNHFFYSEGVDYYLSSKLNIREIGIILRNIDANIISMQFSAHLHFQKYLEGKNVALMFHGSAKEIIAQDVFRTHLGLLKKRGVYNYKKFLLLSNEDVKLLNPHLPKDVQSRFSYMNNSIALDYQELPQNKNNHWAYLGRLEYQKNPMALIDLGKHIIEKNSDLVINVYGDGPLKAELEAEITKYHLENIIILKGYESNKKKVFSENNGLVMFSRFEGYPYVILEAYAHGKPVVLFDTFPAAKELVNNGDTGYLVDDGNIEDLFEKIKLANKIKAYNIEEQFKLYSNERIFGLWNDLFVEMEKSKSLNQLSEKNKGISKLFIKKQINRLKRQLPNIRYKVSYARLEMNNKIKISKLVSLPKISIIIPTFNGRDIIKTAVNSVLKQNYDNIEIIVVDDGSSNPCEDVLKEFNDDRIVYYYKTNSGPGLSRNYGIEKATGEYIFFLDADDKIHQTGLTSLLLYALENDLDVVSGITQRIELNTGNKEKWFGHLYKAKRIDDIETRLNLYNDILSTNKLYKKSIIKKYSLYFEAGLYEDKIFTAKLYSCVKKIGIINTIVYNWYVYGAGTSISTSKTLDNFLERMVAVYKAWKYLPEYRKLNTYGFYFSHDLLIYLREFKYYSPEDKTKIYTHAREFMYKYQEYYYDRFIPNNVVKYIHSLILNDNYDKFVEVCDILSIAYHHKEK
jgi:CDP-glycerol glycerophosphotransferase (TagB/SpsB family)/glycosyltransferase involved in cell wall biosynthesis